MASTAAALKAQFDLQTRLFNNVLDGITDGESMSRNSEHVNHMKWIAGHLVNTRVNSMTRLSGGQPDTSYVAQFDRGVPLDPTATYPPIEELAAKWKETEALSNRFTDIPEEMLDSPAPAKSPILDDTFRGLLAFLIAHEGYHIGQLSILRKMVGKPAMSYN